MKKKILLILIMIIFGISVFCVSGASATTEGIYTYSVSNGKATIKDCDESASGVITIPSTLGGYPVTAIGTQAFYNCTELTKIIIPDGVVYVGKILYNYKGTMPQNTSVVIKKGTVGISPNAFSYRDNLTSVEIPNSMSEIGGYAFSYCDQLTTVYYWGTEEQWNDIDISDGNDCLLNASRIYKEQPHTKTTISDDGKNFVISPVNIEYGKTVILVLYDGLKLVEMQIATYEGEDITFNSTCEYNKAKVMVWNSASVNPGCNAESVK